MKTRLEKFKENISLYNKNTIDLLREEMKSCQIGDPHINLFLAQRMTFKECKEKFPTLDLYDTFYSEFGFDNPQEFRKHDEICKDIWNTLKDCPLYENTIKVYTKMWKNMLKGKTRQTTTNGKYQTTFFKL
jgi:hypothetical protein